MNESLTLARNWTTITRLLTVSWTLVSQSIPQKKNGTGRPRIVTNSVPNYHTMNNNKNRSLNAGLRRATTPDVAALSYRVYRNTKIR
jgi:hypothetical protein